MVTPDFPGGLEKYFGIWQRLEAHGFTQGSNLIRIYCELNHVNG